MRLQDAYPDMKFSDDWLVKHFPDVVNPKKQVKGPVDLLDPEQRAKELAHYEQLLRDVYLWRLKWCYAFRDGRAGEEFRSAGSMIYFDEIKRPVQPGSKLNFTVGLAFFGNDRLRILPLVITKGVLQPKNCPNNIFHVQLEPTEGKKERKYPIMWFENDKHWNNAFLYQEWIRCAILPSIQHDIPRDRDDFIRRERLMTLFLDDRAKFHNSPNVKKLLADAYVSHMTVRLTSLEAVNDNSLNAYVQAEMNKKLDLIRGERLAACAKNKQVTKFSDEEWLHISLVQLQHIICELPLILSPS
jgi:hypothetical protein